MLKNLLAIDKNPIIVKYSQTVWAKIIFLTMFGLFIYGITIFPNISSLYPDIWRQTLIITVGMITFIPKYRYLWLFIAMISLIAQTTLIRTQPDWMLFKADYYLQIYKNGYEFYFPVLKIKYFDIGLMLLITESIVYCARRFQHYKVMQYPVATSYLFLFTLILIASYAQLPKIQIYLLWSFISIYNHYFWFTAYTLRECKIIKERNYLLDYARYLPIWGFTELPFGKGSLYLRQVEAKNSEEFAVTQLKAVKLGIWAFILYIALHFMYKIEDYFNIPWLEDILNNYGNNTHYSVSFAWVCLLDSFFRKMLELTVMGHCIVAVCRMCGFRILRNTYKPLQAPTIAEYWNRYNFYFKELLVEFCFYPTFFRFFKTRPKLRIFFATLSAATFGNILFHFLLLTPVIMSYGFMQACKGFFAYICYAIVLGVSIGLSQLHTLSERKPKAKWNEYLVSPVIVVIFYALLGLFSLPYGSEGITANLKFLANLFNIAW